MNAKGRGNDVFHDVERWLKRKLTGKVTYSDLLLAYEYAKALGTYESLALYRRLLKHYHNQKKKERLK